jgi:hypothetical protein
MELLLLTLPAKSLPALSVIAGAPFRAGGLALGVINVGALRRSAARKK